MMYPTPDEIMAGRVILDPLRLKLARTLSLEVGEYLVNSSTLEVDRFLDRIALEFRYEVLAERMPPAEVRHPVVLVEDDPRHATWWDMFKATYRGRWWMRWRAWEVAYTSTPVTVRRDVVVNIQGHFTFPQAPRIGDRFGQPVAVAIWNTSDWPA